VAILIVCKAIGCADMTASRNSWVERNGETMTVGCNHSRQTWHLVCKGNQWVGDISNCSWGGKWPRQSSHWAICVEKRSKEEKADM